LAWSKGEGYKLLRDFDLRSVQAYRATWKDGALAKKKSKNASPASSGSVFAPDGLLRTLQMDWAESL